jgi:hypothetical protein
MLAQRAPEVLMAPVAGSEVLAMCQGPVELMRAQTLTHRPMMLEWTRLRPVAHRAVEERRHLADRERRADVLEVVVPLRPAEEVGSADPQ